MKLDINKDTVLCMSIAGRPGNFGTRFHNFLYDRLGLNFLYKAFTTSDIRAAVGGIRALGIRGCAISMPFKESCMEFLDCIEGSAAGIQSVNTIVNDGGRLTGFNTDYLAVRSLLGRTGISTNTPFALMGSGGMAKAVACALRDLGFKEGWIVARNEKTGRALAAAYGYDWAPRFEGPAPLLINASPVGMAGGAEASSLPFPESALGAAACVFDVVAIPVETPLIRNARAKGKKLITGAEVAELQALEQFVMYTGIRPEPELVKEAAAYARAV
jgi:shikimate dehydrogenase